VIVKELPQRISGHHARLFLGELEDSMNGQRPCVVLDCSRIHQMDIPAIHLLLDCLEHAMKHNGDIKLAGVLDEAKAMLELTGVARLFEQFNTNADAIRSFQRPPLHAIAHGSSSSAQSHAAEHAA
jgi:anti-sigma B factor antagonist